MKIPKIQCSLPGCLLLFTLASALAQQPSAPGGFSERLRTIISQESGAGQTNLTRFDLDFPGGTPKALVDAIQKASGRPVNVIIPEELDATKLPALKMRNVSVPELFQGLSAASQERQTIIGQGGGGYTTTSTGYGFRTQNPISDNSIWSFYAEKPIFPNQTVPKVCRFYSLAGYLERGTTVDDITTAIKTGAKMLGEGTEPQISFHKDTKLLIAVGEPRKLEIIDSVLKALDSWVGPPSAHSGPHVENQRSEKK